MKDVLLIDSKNRCMRDQTGRHTHFAREFNLFTANTRRKTMEMLKTAVMDAVIVNLDGMDETSSELFEVVDEIAREYPRVEILYLSASEYVLPEGQHQRHGYIRHLRECLLPKSRLAIDQREKQGRLDALGASQAA